LNNSFAETFDNKVANPRAGPQPLKQPAGTRIEIGGFKADHN
jgi:hypothetical protein